MSKKELGPADYLFNTDADERSAKEMKEALRKLIALRELIEDNVEPAMKRYVPGGVDAGQAFPFDWIAQINDGFMGIFNSVAKANGMVLVRGTPPKTI